MTPTPSLLFMGVSGVDDDLDAAVQEEELQENVSSSSSSSSNEIANDKSSSSPSPSPSLRNINFNDFAESPAPPLNYEKHLTMQVGSSLFFRVDN